MKLRLDATKCSGYGACADACPTMFKIDEFGYAALQRNGAVPVEEEQRALLAVRNCAQHAIAVEGNEGSA